MSLYAIPFYTLYVEKKLVPLGLRTFDEQRYIKDQSILAYLAGLIIDTFYQDHKELKTEDIESPDFQNAFNNNYSMTKANQNLIIILVESFESWLITNNSKLSSPLPNITEFIKNNNILFASKVKSQIKYGESGDGQMTLNSGFLPISTGAATISYNKNTYSNIAESFDNSVLINPCKNNVWNQDDMTSNYGYKQQIHTFEETDAATFLTLVQYTDTAKIPFIAQAITLNTHLPFDIGKNNRLNLSAETPTILKNYINAFAYMDSTFGIFLEKFKQDSVLQNSIILITGDHTIFKKENLATLKKYAQKNELDFDDQGYIPLIIYSPNFHESKTINEIVYQMDIFPTLLHLLGQDNYYFKGFGVNLLDSTARNTRYYSEKTAYEISDKIIRSNYLKKFQNNEKK